jgi:hypothetical protein
MAKHGRVLASAKPYSVHSIVRTSGDRIPHSGKVDPADPARAMILINLHQMELAGVEIDERAVDIATKLGRWRHEENLKADPVESGDVPASKKKPREAGDRQTWVYYIRIGHLIKIGTSMALETRFCVLRPNEVLALEPGGEILEQRRHEEFASMRASGEYFHPGPTLQRHILALRQNHGAPDWTASIVPDGQDWFTAGAKLSTAT